MNNFWKENSVIFEELGWDKFETIDDLEAQTLDELAYSQTYSDYFEEEEITTAEDIKKILGKWDQSGEFIAGIPQWREVMPGVAALVDNDTLFENYRYFYCPEADSFGCYVARDL